MFLRHVDVFAAYVAYTDNEIGRVIQEIEPMISVGFMRRRVKASHLRCISPLMLPPCPRAKNLT
jgi:hypothetical protein